MHETLDAARASNGTSPVAEVDEFGANARLEDLLARVLADVLDVPSVPATADFFAELGADSLVMAHFCARLAKRGDLPSPSIKEVYQHPTIRGLAAALSAEAAGPVRAAPAPAPSPPIEATAPVGRWTYTLCGAMQLLTLFEFAALAAVVAARGYDWISAGSGLVDTYLRSAIFGGGIFVVWSVVGIAAKWVLVGRWRPERFRIWSLRYVAFWFVRFLVGANPLRVFVGTPIYVFYLRALGAKIGRNVVVLSGSLPVCADLLTIGDNTVVRKDSAFTCYRADGGFIQTGPVTIGADALVGEATVLDIDTSIGDGAQVGHGSAVLAGQSIPDGEHRVGSPATQATEVDYRNVAPTERGPMRRVSYSIAQLLVLFAVTLPLPISIGMALAESRISPTGLFSPEAPLFSRTTFVEALVFSLALFVIVTIVRLVIVLTVPRLLRRAIKPNTTYPLYGIRFWAHRTISTVSNVSFFTNLFGDSSYIVHYLYALGYDVSFDEQTGANFGLNVKHDNPFNVSVGPGTMAADGLSIINTDYSSSSFRLSPATIGAHSFLGNQVAYPSQAKTGENCLYGSKVMVPVEGDARENVGFLGSPSFEIPRLVLRDRKFDDMKQGDEFTRRLAAKNRHNTVTIGLFLLVRLVALFGAALLLLGTADLYTRFGAQAILAVSVLATVAGTLYYAFIDRAATGFKRLQPLYCAMYERESWQMERYWKLSQQPTVFNGTPLRGLVWRLFGVRVGKRLFDDGALLIEKTMITIGDDCALNVASVVQPHSQEDGSFKSDDVTIGNGCTLGVASLVHYGVTMGDGATLAPNAFLMKGAEVEPNTHWGENPARDFGGGGPVEPAAEPVALPPSETAAPPEPTPEPPQPSAPSEPTAPPPSEAGLTAMTNGGEDHMRTRGGTDRDYWRDVLTVGGATAIPRWTLGPKIDEHEVALAGDLVAALRRLAGGLDVSFSSILLAAHAQVLAALAGERDVATGYVAANGGQPLPCRVTTEPDTWRELLLTAHRVESEMLSHDDSSIDELRRELGLTEPPFETALDVTGLDVTGADPSGFDPSGANDLSDGTVFSVVITAQGGNIVLRLRYRSDLLDADSATRMAGYHLTALDLLAADPNADHRSQSPAGRPGDDPRAAAVRRRHRRRPGGGHAGGAVIPRGAPVLAGARPPQPARAALRLGDRRGVDAGAHQPLVRHHAGDQAGQCLRPDRNLR